VNRSPVQLFELIAAALVLFASVHRTTSVGRATSAFASHERHHYNLPTPSSLGRHNDPASGLR
jgi:hypothetical protein